MTRAIQVATMVDARVDRPTLPSTESAPRVARPLPHPKVSIIVPNYNHAPYLRQRIDSILAQTYTNFDLILMDDASTDHSRSILEAYSNDPRVVRLILNKTNSGSTFKQWNKGVAAVTGEYIWIAESDDYADPRLLDRLVSLLDQHPQVGVAYCESNIIDSDDRLLRTSHRDFVGIGDLERYQVDFVSNGREECAEYLIQWNVIPNASATLFRRSLFERVGGADESMRLCGDWKLWVSMLLQSDLAHVAEPLNFYRTHKQNVRSLTKLWVSILENVQVMNLIKREMEVRPIVIARQRKAIADAWINARLWGTLPDRELRRRAFDALMEFDPHFRRLLAQRILCRATRVTGTGKIGYWINHVLHGKHRDDVSLP